MPIGDVNPTRRRAVMTWVLVGLNVVVFAYQTSLAGCSEAQFLYRYAAVPRELMQGAALAPGDLGAVLGPCAVAGLDKSVLTSAVTAMFLHGGVAHLVGNMVFLAVFGNNVEDRLGRIRFVGFYLAGGLAATAAHVAVTVGGSGSLAPLVGASGAIAAVLGAYLVMFPRASVFTVVPFPLYLLALVIPRVRIRSMLLVVAIVVMPAWLMLAGWFGMQFLAVRNPVADGVAYEAHVAGFLAGLVLVLLLDRRRLRHGQTTFHPLPASRRPRR
ncbi:MAG TPA: rhomboid family intramembrane serine protease [Egicoccus sp.]|nr:rhomboid family intramembrane serine protease [Egicoccus sp.]HSK24318.1 rhomboid family intramembrane serine protease [Egicoccus sp.]